MIKPIDFYTEKRGMYLSMIRKYCKGNWDDAEDIYQTVCVNLVLYPKELPEAGVEPYLYTVVSRAIWTWNKDQQSRGTVRLSDSDVEEESHPDQVGLTFAQLHGDNLSETLDPLDRLLEQEKLDKIPAVISKVSNELHRKLLTMVYVEDVSQVAAAELCGIEASHAHVICSRFVGSFS